MMTTGAGLRPRRKRLGMPPDPTAISQAAPQRVTAGVSEQKSAEGILGDHTRTGVALKARTR